MKNWDTFKKELLKNPKFRTALKETELEYQISRAIIEARVRKGLTQRKLAENMHTTQSVISRVESAQSLPSLTFLHRLAQALNVSLQVQFK